MGFLDTKIIVLILLQLYMLCSQELQSPCPNVFEYRNEGGVLHGFIQIRPMGSVPSILTKINFTIATALPSNNVGKLEYLGGSRFPTAGSLVSYRVHFPVTYPVPKITAIQVNNDVLCYGSGDVPGPGEYVSTVGLQHMVYQPGGISSDDGYPPWSPPVTTTPRPLPVQTEIPWTPPRRQPPSTPPPPRIRPPTYYYTPEEEPVTPPPRRTTPPPTEPPTRKPPRTRPRPPVTTAAPDTGEECGQIKTPAALIYYGDSYERGEWPWLVAIYRKKEDTLSYVCSGTLVSDRHVITAAHCMQQKSSRTAQKDFVVKIGVFNLEDWAEEDTATRTLASAYIHENFSPSTLANDILVLTFKSRVTFNDYIRPICLWKGDPDLERVVGKKGVVAGWGQSELGPAGRGEPRAVRIPIVSTETCKASKPDFHKLTSSFTLCAGDKDGAGPCLGDSGGGLYYFEGGRWRLRGIVSLSLRPENGDSTCNLNEYIVFTDTAQYMPWIRNYI